MRTLIAIVLAALLTASPVLGQQTQSDDRYRIKLFLNGASVEGSQERAARMVGKTRAEQLAILDEPLHALRAGSLVAVTVHVTDPNGVTADYSRTARVTYEAFGCLKLSTKPVMSGPGTTTGVATTFIVSPADASCDMPDMPSFWIFVIGPDGKAIAHNEYLFLVTSRV